jgi:single-strand DNA-binding protein
MSSLNRVLLIGNLTRDPEVRTTPKGVSVADLGLAINRAYTTEGGEKHEEVTFVDVVCWGRLAENAGRYLAKGRPIFVEGRLKLDTWQDKASGENRQRLRVVAERLQFLGSAPGREGASGQAPRGDAEPERLATLST